MQVIRVGGWILMLFLLACSRQGRTDRTIVEVRANGDDGLTLRLRDAIERAATSSNEFQIRTAQKTPTLIVSIVSNVEWQTVGTRTRLTYQVQFADNATVILGKNSGSCWEDALSDCSAEVLRSAKLAKGKL
jgi:hypothetical protein